MAGYKETPRQKMIGLMYLVLTALLALNVSKNVLDAFVVVNESLETTNENFTEKVDAAYNEFALAYQKEPAKSKEAYEKSQQVQATSKNMVDYLSNIKNELIARAEKTTPELAADIKLRDVGKKDNFDIPTNYFIVGSNGENGVAYEMKGKIEEFKTDMLSFVKEKNRDGIKVGLDTKGPFYNADGKEEPWERHNFYHTIIAADVAILNDLIAQVKNLESDVVNHLLTSIGKTDFKFNKVDAAVIPASNYVLQGSNYEAKIFVAAFDTAEAPKILVNGQEIATENGVGMYSVPASSIGEKEFTGTITVKSPTGDQEYEFGGEYIVAAPTATVSADKMNVFYIGLQNPVSISVPGIPASRISASMSGGSLSRSGGGWIATVTGGSTCKINVSAQMGEGGSRSMGGKDFRIKKVPPPRPMVGGLPGGPIARSRLLAAPYVVAKLQDFLFEGVQFNVTSYDFSTLKPDGLLANERIRGARLNAGAIEMIKRTRRGQKVYFENIKATGPGGQRNLGSVILTIK